MSQNEPKILINVTKFKEVLLQSWNLLDRETQMELASLGIYPK
jgi:hypothetical protein